MPEFAHCLFEVILCYAEHLHSSTRDPSFDLEYHVFVICPELVSLGPRPIYLPQRWESWDPTQAEKVAGFMHHPLHTAAAGFYGSHLKYHPESFCAER